MGACSVYEGTENGIEKLSRACIRFMKRFLQSGCRTCTCYVGLFRLYRVGKGSEVTPQLRL